MDTRLDQLQTRMDITLNHFQIHVDMRFEGVEQRMHKVQNQIERLSQ